MSSVASSLTTVSARVMLLAMIGGERDPLVLAEMATGRMRRPGPGPGPGTRRAIRRPPRSDGQDHPDSTGHGQVDEPDLLRTWGSVPQLVATVETELDALGTAAQVASIASTRGERDRLGGVRAATSEASPSAGHLPEPRRTRPAGRWGALLRLGVTLAALALAEHPLPSTAPPRSGIPALRHRLGSCRSQPRGRPRSRTPPRRPSPRRTQATPRHRRDALTHRGPGPPLSRPRATQTE